MCQWSMDVQSLICGEKRIDICKYQLVFTKGHKEI